MTIESKPCPSCELFCRDPMMDLVVKFDGNAIYWCSTCGTIEVSRRYSHETRRCRLLVNISGAPSEILDLLEAE